MPSLDSLEDTFRLEMDRLALRLDGRCRRDAVAGCYIERRHLPKAWAVTAYVRDLKARNPVEFTIVPSRALDRADERPAFTAWLDAQATELGRQPTRVRREDVPVDTWRGGFTFDDAIELVRRWCEQCDPMRSGRRWSVLALGALTAAPAPVPSPPAPVTAAPVERALAAMVASARAAAAQSGQVHTEVTKHKEVRFPDDEAFQAYLATLFAQQQGRCRLSGLPLLPGREEGDMQPSLDRIDSDGHYEPGNLQIVCGFINRWKSDDSNENFVRLLQAVRTSSGPDT